jgi:hypothetical protein
MAENGNLGSTWPAFGNSSMGINFLNSTSIGLVDYSTCIFWDSINAQLFAEAEGGALTVSGSGNNATIASGTSSATPTTTGTSTAVPSKSVAEVSRKVGRYWVGIGTVLGIGMVPSLLIIRKCRSLRPCNGHMNMNLI